MTQEQVQAATGIAQVTLSRWEHGSQPALEDLARLEAGLGVARGTILREAGFVEENPRTVGELIDSDPTLEAVVRPVVWSAYRAAQDLSAELRPLFGQGHPEPSRGRAKAARPARR